MIKLKHLPEKAWPATDRMAFNAIFGAGDIFEDTSGAGAHLADGTRRIIKTAYRRWLGFVYANHAGDFALGPAERIRPSRVREFVELLSVETQSTSVAIVIDNLHFAARLLSPTSDWNWLQALKSRLLADAQPADRFPVLVPPWLTLELGIELMDTAPTLPSADHKRRDIQYRDGLLVALLSVWPIRRRSIAALTLRHIEVTADGMNILLDGADTKSKRPEEFSVPAAFVPYFVHYLAEVHPRLQSGSSAHDGLWGSYRGGPLSAGRIYDVVRARIRGKFGKAMGLHDFRRAAATFLAIAAPEQVGLTSGILQHASPEISERHYNLARSVQAGTRYAAHLADSRRKLRQFANS